MLSYDSISRREFLTFAANAGAFAFMGGFAVAETVVRKPIPKTGEPLPVIGLGTWQTFDVGAGKTARAPLKQVLQAFAAAAGRVIDSSPMYGRAESVVGDLAAELGAHKQFFLATKVWTSGRAAGVRQMEESLRRLRTERLDLMQVHNLVDYRTHLETLSRWKAEGRVRYVGVTHYTASAHDELARVITSRELDFVQLNYSLAEREAENRLLPLAAERQLGVLINRPFAEGQLFRRVRGQALPPWAKEIGCASWAQFFLKFIVSHPAVTCAIPATSKVEHLTDNMGAAREPMPDEKIRERMARYFASL